MQTSTPQPESLQSLPTNTLPVQGLRVSIGGGDVSIQDFIRIDIDASTRPDRVMDARKLEFAPGSVDILYASHVLEHIRFQTTNNKDRWSAMVDLLSSWRECLSANGCLYIGVPDLARLGQLLVENGTQPDIQRIVLDTVYGGSRSEYDVHYCGFTKSLLTDLLHRAGFPKVEEFTPFVQDETSHLLLGKPLSLNLVAYNGSSLSKPQLEKQAPEAEADPLQFYMRVADERRAEILTLTQACDERLALINKLQGELIQKGNSSSPKFWLGKLRNKMVNLVRK